MNIDDHNGTTVLRRTTEPEPPRSLKDILIGRPLATASAPHQTIGKLVGLAIFASDALSSTAYATQEMLVVLAGAGTVAFGYVFPLSLVIVGLLIIVTASYEQTIHAYPNGGGAYIVSRDNLGDLPAQIAASALLMDYVLTVSVSVSSGIAQIVSAFPALFEYRAYVAVALVVFIMVINLRGVRESGIIFAIPTYLFILSLASTVIIGLARYIFGGLGTVISPPDIEMTTQLQTVSFFLILHAFANGTTALTGVEAISNGIPSFKEPRTKNAGITLLWMSSILGVLLLGVSFLAGAIQAVPSESETIISQIVRTVFGDRNAIYMIVIAATTVILVMAANTSFNGFPSLAALAAVDGFLPRQLAYRGSRLVYSRGIYVLAFVACLLILAFSASVTRLIPLYAIGVFLSFTLSQIGMARRWHRSGQLKPGETLKNRGKLLEHDPRWKTKMVINSFGALCTFVVMIVFAITKFMDGAWVVIFLIPMLVVILMMIQRHYKSVASRLSMDNYGTLPMMMRHRVILPIGGVHRGTMAALRYALTLSDDITAVHISVNPEEAEKVREKWEVWGQGVRLVIIESAWRRFVEPLIDYVDDIYEKRQPNELITIIVPQFVTHKPFARLLHTNTATTLRKALMFKKGIVITDVPYPID